MSGKAVPQPCLVKREEKDSRLKNFILQHLKQRNPGAAHCLLIARSADSPVARTLLSMGARAELKGFTVRAIFAQLGTAETARIAEACRVSDWALQIRWARDLRLLEAHEQLVISPALSWIGDCMRRDPLSRDACELYSPDCLETARQASLFFERIWQNSEPIFERQSVEMAAPDAESLPPVEQIVASGGVKSRLRTTV